MRMTIVVLIVAVFLYFAIRRLRQNARIDEAMRRYGPADEPSYARPLARPPPAPTIPRWQTNVTFTNFVHELAFRLEQYLPESRHDREKLARSAGISLTTIEEML